MELEEEDAEVEKSGKPRKKSSFQDKIMAARATVDEAEAKGKSKMAGARPKGKAGEKSKGHVLGGKDYLKQFEAPRGFYKKLR